MKQRLASLPKGRIVDRLRGSCPAIWVAGALTLLGLALGGCVGGDDGGSSQRLDLQIDDVRCRAHCGRISQAQLYLLRPQRVAEGSTTPSADGGVAADAGDSSVSITPCSQAGLADLGRCIRESILGPGSLLRPGPVDGSAPEPDAGSNLGGPGHCIMASERVDDPSGEHVVSGVSVNAGDELAAAVLLTCAPNNAVSYCLGLRELTVAEGIRVTVLPEPVSISADVSTSQVAEQAFGLPCQ